jgi:carboxylate-amine ligase
MSSPKSYQLFEVLGVELEYMLVDRQSLDVRPIADLVLHDAAGEPTSDFVDGDITWSNELALHVIELKTTHPVSDWTTLGSTFHKSLGRLNQIAAAHNAMLLPTAMHPWMDPGRELRLWPHDNSEIYQAFDRIFDCRGHGWSNLQSMHLNLPFANDSQFCQLHSAIRLLLPVLPALTASSPIADEQDTGFIDYRMEVYRNNSRAVPQVAGLVVPDFVHSEEDYNHKIYQPMFRAIAPLDPSGILQRPFLNARGAIARFDRKSIEIRVLDVQECPACDVAYASLIVETLRAIVAERWQKLEIQARISTETLASIFRQVIRIGADCPIDDPDFLAMFGCASPLTAKDLWRHIMGELSPTMRADSQLATLPDDAATAEANADPLLTQRLIDRGPVSSVILKRLKPDAARIAGGPMPMGTAHASLSDMTFKRDELQAVYRELADCLQRNQPLTESPATVEHRSSH